MSDARHLRGAVSAVVAPGRPDSGGSQFFICVVNQPGLDGRHSIWGQVAEGMDVVEAIEAEPTDGETPVHRIEIVSVEVVRR